MAHAVSGLLSGPGRRGTTSPEQWAALLDEPFCDIPGLPQCPVRDLPLTELPLTPRAARALRELDVTTVGALLKVPVETLLAQWSFGEQSLKTLQQQLSELILAPSRGAAPARCDSFDAMVLSLIRQTAPNARIANILQHRLGTNGQFETLAAIGQRLGITRERVRQLEHVGISALATAPARLAVGEFWKEVWSVLRTWGRACPIERIAVGLQRRMQWKDSIDPDALARFLDIHPALTITDAREVAFKN